MFYALLMVLKYNRHSWDPSRTEQPRAKLTKAASRLPIIQDRNGESDMVTKTPWAILLCKLQGDDSEPLPRGRYEEIFTSAGSGRWNIPDFFRDMSHGQLDLSGSEVFGWYQLDQPYSGSGANPQGRQDLITWARQKATDGGVNLGKFFSVVVVLNQPADLFGGPAGAVCGCDSLNRAVSNLSPALMGQEMGHVYGLDHSRAEGSTADYADPFDVMSNLAAGSTPHPDFNERDPVDGTPVYRIGPGLNAANMWSRGWLDMTRVWSSLSGSVSAALKLRPLHRRDLDGYLVIRFGSYFIEYRTGRGWDAALDPCVLVHRFEDNRSYLVPDDKGHQQLVEGSTLSSPSEASVLGSGYTIRVDSIDD